MLIDSVKLAMRITATEYDAEISRLIDAAVADLGIVDVEATSETDDALLIQAIITFCRLNFGTPEDYEKLKASYDEQKAQLISNKNYGLKGWLPND